MNSAELEWRFQRLSKMTASEVRWRISDHVRRRRWASRQIMPDVTSQSLAFRSGSHRQTPWDPGREAQFRPFPSEEVLRAVPEETRQGVIAAAEEILAGRWQLLGVLRRDMEDPDWFFDPITGRRAPQADYCFKINHRSEDVTGNVKQIWELSRMHHLTLLAAAFGISGDERYAERAAAHLRSWWSQNPFLSGVHWTSGIEAGLRLTSWVWVRRLLDNWTGAAKLFERNELARAQIWWHQHYLASFRSRGSSANNHVIAEAAGLLVGALAFDWFAESSSWVEEAARVLERELTCNTFPSGVNREMAFDYHGFVAELAAVAGAEASWAGHPLSSEFWTLLFRMFDVVAATVDVKVRAPRQGDGDNGTALVLDPPPAERWSGLLAIGEALFASPAWWPTVEPTVTSTLLASMAGRRRVAARADRRPNHYADAGMTVLRSSPQDGQEIWCRCDAGPHGFLSIAAHAHADALSVEVRYNGVDVLSDPGTYCYHGEPRWRSYFRSTLAHNTIEVDGQDQSTSGGPFLWTRHARSRVTELDTDAGGVAAWSAEHDGYRALTPPLLHRRSVRLAGRLRQIEIVDCLETTGRHVFRLAFHLGPDIDAHMVGHSVALTWSNGESTQTATLSLPVGPSWSLSKGETDPILGWYSSRFGEKQPAWTVMGEGACTGTGVDVYTTVLQFHGHRNSPTRIPHTRSLGIDESAQSTQRDS
jgi:Heparinase II/III-like protein/Heparinase II/III N-terminus